MDMRFYLARLLRNVHWVVLLTGFGLAGGVFLAIKRPPVYEAQARLLVEAEQIPGDLAISTVRTQALAQLELTLQRILGSESLLALANRHGVYATVGGKMLLPDALVKDMRSRIEMTHANTRDAAPLVSITFTAPFSGLAADVTNDIVGMILEEDIATRTRTARKTLEFFTHEATRLEGELAAQDERILAFRQQNIDALPDSLTFRRTQQTTEQERLLEVERQIGNLQERRAKMERRQETRLRAAAAPNSLQSAEQMQLAQLQEELAAQSTLLSPENPRVNILRAQVQSLSDRITAQGIDQVKLDIMTEPLTDYDLQRAEINGDLAYLTERKDRILNTLTRLSASIDATTSNAIILANLERDQANTRLQHDQAVANKARAETGKTIEALRQGQHISLFEPAVAPLRPQGPTDVTLITAGLGLGLASGIAFVLFLELSSKRLRRAEDLTIALGITPFATLPYLPSRAEILRKRAFTFATAGVFIVAIPLGISSVRKYSEQGVLFPETLHQTDIVQHFPKKNS